jgi:hypothetical protein
VVPIADSFDSEAELFVLDPDVSTAGYDQFTQFRFAFVLIPGDYPLGDGNLFTADIPISSEAYPKFTTEPAAIGTPSVPEPSSLLLLGMGLAALFALAHRNRTKSQQAML